MFGVIALGAGAVLSLLPANYNWSGVCSAGAAILGALDLTFDLSNRARAHSLMKRRYFELLGDLADSTKTPREVEAYLHRYSADEEPAYHALLAASWNAAQDMIYGDDALEYDIPKWHRRFQNFVRREGVRYKLKNETNNVFPSERSAPPSFLASQP